jgi:hypothetical protein
MYDMIIVIESTLIIATPGKCKFFMIAYKNLLEQWGQQQANLKVHATVFKSRPHNLPWKSNRQHGLGIEVPARCLHLLMRY